MAINRHISVRGARRRKIIVIAVTAAVVAVAAGKTVAPSSASGRAEAAPSYQWPVKPFNRQHPVRGGFGDPRSVFRSAPTLQGVLSGACSCSLHRGIDISAPDGSAVYPVASGTVTVANGEWLKVDSGDGRAFEYWHIHPMVRVGARVVAHETVIGHIHRGSGHVHLTELSNGQAVNPLAPGHIGPYADHTTPRVTSISFRKRETSRDGLPSLISGRVLLVAGAEDAPTMSAPQGWRGLPVTPALLTWEVRSWTGKVVKGRQIAADFRSNLPDRSFWQVYARGSYQNMAVLGRHYSWAQPGSYLFKLSPAFDSRALRDGAYDLVVTATDIRGNSSSLTRRFTIKNRRR
jgi:murein DD-endopeptidase MepM/ murein hydrolase activator NlpD